jgi:hypothetical protein
MGQSGVDLTNALSIVRSMLDEPVPQFWTNTELTTWLNEACADIERRSETLRNEYTTTVTANTQDYSAPNDVLRIYRCEFQPTQASGAGQLTYPLEYRGLLGMDQYWGNLQSQPASFPALYTLWYAPVSSSQSPAAVSTQLQIRLYPVPSQSGTLNIYYYRQIVSVSAGTDTLDCLPGWEDCVYDYTVYKALRKDADPRWKDQQSLYESKLTNMIDTTRSFTDQPDYISTGPVGQPSWLLGGDW